MWRARLRECVCVNASRGLLKGLWGGHLQPTVVCYPSHDSWPEFELIDEPPGDPAFITAVAEAQIRSERKRRCCHIWSITFMSRLFKVCWVKNQFFTIHCLIDSLASRCHIRQTRRRRRRRRSWKCCAGQATSVRVANVFLTSLTYTNKSVTFKHFKVTENKLRITYNFHFELHFGRKHFVSFLTNAHNASFKIVWWIHL